MEIAVGLALLREAPLSGCELHSLVHVKTRKETKSFQVTKTKRMLLVVMPFVTSNDALASSSFLFLVVRPVVALFLSICSYFGVICCFGCFSPSVDAMYL